MWQTYMYDGEILIVIGQGVLLMFGWGVEHAPLHLSIHIPFYTYAHTFRDGIRLKGFPVDV